MLICLAAQLTYVQNFLVPEMCNMMPNTGSLQAISLGKLPSCHCSDFHRAVKVSFVKFVDSIHVHCTHLCTFFEKVHASDANTATTVSITQHVLFWHKSSNICITCLETCFS